MKNLMTFFLFFLAFSASGFCTPPIDIYNKHYPRPLYSSVELSNFTPGIALNDEHQFEPKVVMTEKYWLKENGYRIKEWVANDGVLNNFYFDLEKRIVHEMSDLNFYKSPVNKRMKILEKVLRNTRSYAIDIIVSYRDSEAVNLEIAKLIGEEAIVLGPNRLVAPFSSYVSSPYLYPTLNYVLGKFFFLNFDINQVGLSHSEFTSLGLLDANFSLNFLRDIFNDIKLTGNSQELIAKLGNVTYLHSILSGGFPQPSYFNVFDIIRNTESFKINNLNPYKLYMEYFELVTEKSLTSWHPSIKENFKVFSSSLVAEKEKDLLLNFNTIKEIYTKFMTHNSLSAENIDFLKYIAEHDSKKFPVFFKALMRVRCSQYLTPYI